MREILFSIFLNSIQTTRTSIHRSESISLMVVAMISKNQHKKNKIKYKKEGHTLTHKHNKQQLKLENRCAAKKSKLFRNEVSVFTEKKNFILRMNEDEIKK